MEQKTDKPILSDAALAWLRERAVLSEGTREYTDVEVSCPELGVDGSIRMFYATHEEQLLWETWDYCPRGGSFQSFVCLRERQVARGVWRGRHGLETSDLARVLEDLGPPQLVRRVRSEVRATWAGLVRDCPLFVPLAELFRLDLVEAVRWADVEVRPFMPLGKTTHVDCRPYPVLAFKGAWTEANGPFADLATVDQVDFHFSSDERRWIYYRASLRFEHDGYAIPEPWRERLYELIRPHLRSADHLRWQFMMGYLRRLQDDIFYGLGEAPEFPSYGYDGYRHVLPVLRELKAGPDRPLRLTARRREKWKRIWQEQWNIITAMRHCHVRAEDVPKALDPQVYRDFDPNRHDHRFHDPIEELEEVFSRVEEAILEILHVNANLDRRMREDERRRREIRRDRAVRRQLRQAYRSALHVPVDEEGAST